MANASASKPIPYWGHIRATSGHYGKALTVYTHTSDQHSVLHTQVIACSVREAIYVPDGLLNNDTILRPTEHFVDQHGFTDQLWSLSPPGFFLDATSE